MMFIIVIMKNHNRVQLTDLDLDIIRHLWFGRKSYAKIAEETGFNIKTVRNRVNKMLKSGAVEITTLLNPFKLHDHQAAFIGFKVLPEQSDIALKKISNLKGIIFTAMVSGHFDIMTIVLFNDKFSYENFVSNEVPKVEEIKMMEAFFAFGSSNFQLRYVL